jgi:hypothetical protein
MIDFEQWRCRIFHQSMSCVGFSASFGVYCDGNRCEEKGKGKQGDEWDYARSSLHCLGSDRRRSKYLHRSIWVLEVWSHISHVLDKNS